MYGYKIKVLSAIVFDKGEGLFDKFIKVMYKRKADAKERGDGVEELLYKLIQNSLFGKAGQKEIIHSFKLIDNHKVKDFELKNKTDLSHVFTNKTLIRTQGRIEAELEGIITKPSALESLYDEEDAVEETTSRDAPKRIAPRKKFGVKSSVSIAAAITAYARINMSRYKNIKGNKYLGGDTDSAIMEKELPQALVGKGLGMMKEECRLSLGLFADKKLYLMRDRQGVTVIKSRGVGREAGGKDILTYADFIQLFRGAVLKIMKTKFIIKKDGVYITPQPLTVRISNIRLAKIKEELRVILANVFHPLYALAVEIGATGSTALAPRGLRALGLTIVTYDFVLVYHNLVLFKQKICNALIPFIIYVGRSGVSLDLPYFRSSIDAGLTPFTLYVDKNSGANLYAQEFNSKVYAGLMVYIIYITPNDIALDYTQFHSKIYAGVNVYIIYISLTGLALDYLQFISKVYCGLINYIYYVTPSPAGNGLVLDLPQFNSKIHIKLIAFIFYVRLDGQALNYQQFNSKIYCGLIVYNRAIHRDLNYSYYASMVISVIFVTPSGICLLSDDPRTKFIFKHYKLSPNSKRVMFKRAIKLYNCNRSPIIGNYPFVAKKGFMTHAHLLLRIEDLRYVIKHTLTPCFTLWCTSYSTKSINDSTILKPVLSAKLLAPIVYDDNILLNLKEGNLLLQRVSLLDKILATLHDDNTVKQFLMEELNDKKIIVCAKLKNDLINNYLNEISKIEGFNYKDGVDSGLNSKSIYRHEIVRNNNCYNMSSFPLSFNQIINAAGYMLTAKHSLYEK